MSFRSIPLLLACGAILGAASAAAQQDDSIHMNQIQMVGSHNSYHAGIAPSEAKLMQEKNPEVYAALDYRHKPLTDQLNSGVRQIELDIYADTKGGLYADPLGPKLVAKAGLPPDPDFDPQHLMQKPGFKVMHVQDFDYRSTCQPFTACLAEVRVWSKAHPRHLPIYVLVETKQGALNLNFPTTQPERFTPAIFDDLDREIQSVFAADETITPDQVRGTHATLEEAILGSGWPTMAQARGKVVFLMDQKAMGPVYVKDHPSLKGRVLFTNAAPGDPDAAFIEQNDANVDAIVALVRKGYLVRTMTDVGVEQVRNNNTTRRDALLPSGAQMLSTDYPASEPASSGFVVELPNHLIARCNPVLQPKGCVDEQLEPAK